MWTSDLPGWKAGGDASGLEMHQADPIVDFYYSTSGPPHVHQADGFRTLTGRDVDLVAWRTCSNAAAFPPRDRPPRACPSATGGGRENHRSAVAASRGHFVVYYSALPTHIPSAIAVAARPSAFRREALGHPPPRRHARRWRATARTSAPPSPRCVRRLAPWQRASCSAPIPRLSRAWIGQEVKVSPRP